LGDRRQAIRKLVFGFALGGAFVVCIQGLSAWAVAANLGKPGTNFDIVNVMNRRLPELHEVAGAPVPAPHHIVVLGDSTVASYPPGRQVPDAIEDELNAIAEPASRIHALSLAISGVASFDYYFLADEIIAAKPDGIVFSFNLDTLSDTWRQSYSRPELAGLVRPRRILQSLGLPLWTLGLTTDRFLFSVAVVQGGGYEAWNGLLHEQARSGRARTAVRDYFDAALGGQAGVDFKEAADSALLAEILVPGYKRFKPAGAELHYRGAMQGIPDNHPVLRAFDECLATFAAAGIPVFVYLTPTNVEFLASVGVFDPDGLGRTIGQIEAVARRHDADFVDLHDLLPDAAFRDATGHFTTDAPIDGPVAVARALAPSYLDHIRAHYPAPGQTNDAQQETRD
jgi:hypothetical protein